MWKTKGNAQDEVLIWGVPGRLDTELTLLALSFLLTPSLRPSVFVFFHLSNGPSECEKHKAAAKCQSRNFFPLFMVHWHVAAISPRHRIPSMAKHNKKDPK